MTHLHTTKFCSNLPLDNGNEGGGGGESTSPVSRGFLDLIPFRVKLMLNDAIFLTAVIARQIAGRLHRVPCPHCNLTTLLGLQRLHRVSWCYRVQFFLQLDNSAW